jgi:hypothetical protein
MLLNFFGKIPLSDCTLDIHRSKDLPKPGVDLQAALESLFHTEARFEEADTLDRAEMSNVAKCTPATISMAPVVGELAVNPDFNVNIL